MKNQANDFLKDDLAYKKALTFVNSIEESLQEIIQIRTNGVFARLQKVLKPNSIKLI